MNDSETTERNNIIRGCSTIIGSTPSNSAVGIIADSQKSQISHTVINNALCAEKTVLGSTPTRRAFSQVSNVNSQIPSSVSRSIDSAKIIRAATTVPETPQASLGAISTAADYQFSHGK